MCGEDLLAEALVKGVGSSAVMLIGPTANAEAWHNRAAAALVGRLCRCTHHGRICPRTVGRTCPDEAWLDDCNDERHPLWVLGTIENEWRDALDQPSDLRQTVPRAVDYLSRELHRIATTVTVDDGQAPELAHAAAEIAGCRHYVENVIQAGERATRSNVTCLDCGSRLEWQWADREPDDHWRCPRCRRAYDGEQFNLAKRQHLASEAADAWVNLLDAAHSIGRSPKTVRTWVNRWAVAAVCDRATRARLVWWPDVWQAHREAELRETRRRARSA